VMIRHIVILSALHQANLRLIGVMDIEKAAMIITLLVRIQNPMIVVGIVSMWPLHRSLHLMIFTNVSINVLILVVALRQVGAHKSEDRAHQDPAFLLR